MGNKRLRERPIWPSRNIECPKCKANIGQPCMTRKGLYAAVPHIARRDAYRDLIGARHVQRK